MSIPIINQYVYKCSFTKEYIKRHKSFKEDNGIEICNYCRHSLHIHETGKIHIYIYFK